MKIWALRPVPRLGLALLLSGSAAIVHGTCVFAQNQADTQIQAGSQAQNPLPPTSNAAPAPSSKHKKHAAPETPPPQPKPSIDIPVTPLGFAPPAQFYLGDRVAQVSLNFLDEDNLLFTFRVPGLIAREQAPPGEPVPEDAGRAERHIRALVLSLPTGKVTAETMWRLHDYGRFLWMLRDHRFLLRDRNTVQTGDASLHLEPFLRFPGPVKYIALDPEQRLLLADTSEPVAAQTKESAKESAKEGASQETTSDASRQLAQQSGLSSSSIPSAAAPGLFKLDSQDDKPSPPETESLLRVLRMDTGKVMVVSRVPGVVNLSLDGDGYYEALRGNGLNWVISYTDFSGNSTPVLPVESTCYPALDVMAPGLVLASACQGYDGRRLTAMMRDPDLHPDQSQGLNPDGTKNNHRLWELFIPPTKVWPQFARASDSLRIARATLDVTHPMGPSAPLSTDDIRGQSVQVFDLATGKLELTVAASPVLDGGGGFALSPSGKRFAVLNAGAIQIYDLPPVPALALPTASHPVQAQSSSSSPSSPSGSTHR
jgi:hypothetical protein